LPTSAIENDVLQTKSLALRAEATTILEDQGLFRLLQTYGPVEVHGSYGLDLMVWRDLDIYLCAHTGQLASFFELGARIAESLPVHRMHFRNELSETTVGLPGGLYWGIYLRDKPFGAWKIDIWAVSAGELERLLEYQQNIARQLTPASRRLIIELKSRLHTHPQYRRGFGATQIYEAVLRAGVRDFRSFAAYLIENGGPAINMQEEAN
jgi:hypothetical protein